MIPRVLKISISLFVIFNVVVGEVKGQKGGSYSGFYSDPLSPPARTAESKNFWFSLPFRLKELEKGIEKAEGELAALPPLTPKRKFNEFGYHSDFIPKVDGVPEEPLWTLDFDVGISKKAITGIILIPSINERSIEISNYGFPKRFRISRINSKKEITHTYVDWTTEDFPDPGMHPVCFDFSKFINEKLQVATIDDGLRLEVFAGQEQKKTEFFSLGRVHILRKEGINYVEKTEASSTFKHGSFWGQRYLASRKHTLGMPLNHMTSKGGNMIIRLQKSKLREPFKLRVNFPRQVHLSNFSIYPAVDSSGIPGYGFPKQMRFYRIYKGSSGIERELLTEISALNPRRNLLYYKGDNQPISILEIECKDFPVYNGRPTFALGEITASLRTLDNREAKIKDVVVKSSHDVESKDLLPCLDGIVDGREVISFQEWMVGLAARKSHLHQIGSLEAEYLQLQQRWTNVKKIGRAHV